MTETVPITVGIPTYSRGELVVRVLERIFTCDPMPAEVIIHVDESDGELEQKLAALFPTVLLLSSPKRVGPGGGRHRCIQAASQPYFVSFDDDSWPMDTAFFARVVVHLESSDDIGGLAARITQRGETIEPAHIESRTVVDFTGCGHALRVAAYRRVTGYVDRPNAYGLEERDLALQLHADGWKMLECDDLRVFHDTDLGHHRRPEVSASTIENAALLVWLRYPASLWGYGLLQYLNVLWFMIGRGRAAGLVLGVIRTPFELWRHRGLRRPLPSAAVRSYLRGRRQSGWKRWLF